MGSEGGRNQPTSEGATIEGHTEVSDNGPTPEYLQTMAMEILQEQDSNHERELMCYEAMYPDDVAYREKDPLYIYKAVSDPDTMYLHEAMKQTDKDHFIDATR